MLFCCIVFCLLFQSWSIFTSFSLGTTWEDKPIILLDNLSHVVFILVDTKATKLAELRAADKYDKQNPFKDVTHLNLLRVCLSKHNYTTVAANYYQIRYKKSGPFTQQALRCGLMLAVAVIEQWKLNIPLITQLLYAFSIILLNIQGCWFGNSNYYWHLNHEMWKENHTGKTFRHKNAMFG